MPLSARVKTWLPAIAWAGLISVFSTDSFSSDRTSAFILPMLRWVFPNASVQTLELIHVLIRKMAHLVEYFILGIFLVRGLRDRERGWKLRWAIWAIVIAAGYASLDEFHQSFVPSRTASPWDALLDTAGTTVAQVFLWVWHLPRGAVTGEKRRGA